MEMTLLGPDVKPKLNMNARRIGTPTKQIMRSTGGSDIMKPSTESFEVALTSKPPVSTSGLLEVTWYFQWTQLMTTYLPGTVDAQAFFKSFAFGLR